MKQKDIAVIIGVAGFATVIAFALGNFLLAPPEDRQMNVKVIDSISGSFPDVDRRYFNSLSINPTRTVEIGGNNNPSPFTQTNPNAQ